MITLRHILLTLVLFAFGSIELFAADYRYEIDLRGSWKFSIGDNEEWAQPEYNDTDWDQIPVPARWEDNGYRGYNGFAWYRKTFTVSSYFENRLVYLELGYIDDVDEVFFNGVKIGQTGTFPMSYVTAYNAFRTYIVPHSLLNFNGENTIAVRVYDAQLEGGIVSGTVRLGAAGIAVIPEISMNGNWNFELGSKSGDSYQVVVPGQWENQGFYNYNGYAVYTKTVNIPNKLAKEKLIFMAGRIDDFDKIYINGQLIGQTGDYDGKTNSDMYSEYRNYFIPENIVTSGENTVVIKVYDYGGEGGIIEGNVGFITQDKFIEYWKMKRRDKGK